MAELCLGTVQFGLDYGINNQEGRVQTSEVIRIMDYALAHGIRAFDTAAVYGSSEEALGSYLKSNTKLLEGVKIFSKLYPVAHPMRRENPEMTVSHHIEQSLKRLGLQQLEGYYLHTAEEVHDKVIVDQCIKAKESGLIKKLGLSLYEESYALAAIESGIFDIIQMPYNVFDRRLEAGTLGMAIGQSDIQVFGRSPFLQGLLLMSPEQVPDYLVSARPLVIMVDEIVNKYQLNRVKLCIQFAVRSKALDYVLMGVDSLEQLKENIANTTVDSTYEAAITELKETIGHVDEDILFPSRWRKKAL